MDPAVTVVLTLLVGALLVAGLVGALLPYLPGAPLILAGAALYAVATDFTPVGWGRLGILGALTGLGFGLDSVAGAVGARRFGGSRWAVVGALAGGLVSLAVGPARLLLGPAAGAVAGELLRTGELAGSLRSGLGAVVGLVAGAVAEFALAVTMVGLFLWWVWRG